MVGVLVVGYSVGSKEGCDETDGAVLVLGTADGREETLGESDVLGADDFCGMNQVKHVSYFRDAVSKRVKDNIPQ